MNAERYDAYKALIGHVDPFDAMRAHRQTQEGKPERFALLGKQAQVYGVYRVVDRENERLQ